MSFKYTNLVRKITVGSTTAKFVLFMLADHANEHGECFPSIKYLAKETELSDRTIKTAISILEKEGLIEVKRLKGKCNKYKITISAIHSHENHTGDKDSLVSEVSSHVGEKYSREVVKQVHTNHKSNHNQNKNKPKNINFRIF